MKKLLPLLLTLALLFNCSCSSREEADSHQTRPIRVGFSQVGAESSWRVAHTKSIEDALSEANGFDLLEDNARQKQENQLLAIRNFIQQEVDYIVLAPIMETGWDDALQEARDAGIPVIIVDRPVKLKDDSLYACWVGSDFYAEGTTAMEWLHKKLIKDRRQKEDIRILHIKGTASTTPALDRAKALYDATDKHDNWTIASHLEGDFTEAKAYEAVSDYVQNHRDFNVIYSENDNMTFGAMRALDEAGITYGADGDIIIISFDAIRDALYLCIDGKIDLCVECNPLHGMQVADLIRQLEQGRTLPKKIYLSEDSFTAGNLIPELIEARQY